MKTYLLKQRNRTTFTRFYTVPLQPQDSNQGNLFALSWTLSSKVTTTCHPFQTNSNHIIKKIFRRNRLDPTYQRKKKKSFAVNMLKMGFLENNRCPCGEIQTSSHVLNNCTIFHPPHPISETDNEQVSRSGVTNLFAVAGHFVTYQ